MPDQAIVLRFGTKKLSRWFIDRHIPQDVRRRWPVMVNAQGTVIFVPKIDPLLCAAAEIVPLQLLAYYVAKENGCDIDKPKNLAKSVTVE